MSKLSLNSAFFIYVFSPNLDLREYLLGREETRACLLPYPSSLSTNVYTYVVSILTLNWKKLQSISHD